MSVVSTVQPYPGLRPFDFGDREFFFGRDIQIGALRQKLATSRLVAVVGRSGCGKSSLVRAGLVPLLKTERSGMQEPLWRIAAFRPQGRPIEELGKAFLLLKAGAGFDSTGDGSVDMSPLRRSRTEAMLRRSSLGLVEAAGEIGTSSEGDILVIVDQFEEIFRFEGAQGSDMDEPTAFVRLIVSAANAATPRVHVMLTMRLDFLGDCARFQGLPEAISDGQFLVPNLNRAQRRAAIEEPARRCGVTVSPAVTQRLLNEIGDDPDQLPVLQHVLMRTWQQAKGAQELQAPDYERTGGIADAISRHADEVFDKLPSDEDRRITERLFKAISELDRRGRAVRHPLKLAEIASIAQTGEDNVARIIEQFRAPECSFVMPPASEPLSASSPIDISHESLLRRWSKMTGTQGHDGWLLEEDKDGKTYRNLLENAENFATDETAVVPPALTRQRQTWWERCRPNSAWAERYGNKFELVERFLGASTRRARKQRIRAVIWPAIVGLLILSVLFYGALYLGESRKRAEAEAAKEAAESALNEASKAKIEGDRSSRAEEEAAARQHEIDELRRELQQVRGAALPRPDDVVQVVKADPTQPIEPQSTTNQEGYLWIGSTQNGNLQTEAGESVSPTDVRAGRQYIVNLNIYLRSGPPDAAYNQQPSVAVIPPNSRIEARGVPVPYDRPSGQQYWLPVRVVSIGLPTVYFQFTTAPREQAQLLSKELQSNGYKIPGEERVEEAAGKRQVRYFYAQDKTPADKLAQDTAQVLQKLGYAVTQPVTVKDFTDFTGKKNPVGVVELWLDLPAR